MGQWYRTPNALPRVPDPPLSSIQRHHALRCASRVTNDTTDGDLTLNKKNNVNDEMKRRPARRAEPAARLTKPQLRIERIYQALRREICLLDLPPGTVLREQDLADRFEVSRTPIRHVLGRLANDGLVESRQGVGTTVTTLDKAEVFDIYLVRAALAEVIGESDPAPATAELLESLRALSRRCGAIVKRKDVRGYGEINLDFHVVLYTVVRNRPLRDVSDRLFYQTARVWFQVLPEMSWERAVRDLQDEIDEIEDAMERNDPKAIGYIHRNHINKTLVLMRRIFERWSDAAPAA